MGSVRVKIVGLNLPRLVNRLVEKNIYVNNLIVKNRSIKFSIEEDKLSELDKICKLEHKYYIVIQGSNIKRALSKVPYLLGGLLALIISFTYLYSFDSLIFNVDVSYEANQEYDLAKVNSLLLEKGIVPGVLKKDIKPTEIENLLNLEIDDISGCTVKLNGGNLKICVYPSTQKYEVSNNDIISKYNAILTKIEVFAGTTERRVGEMVKTGDVLIKSNNGASGKIEGKVYFVSTFIYNEEQQYEEKTGREYKYKNIKFFNKLAINGKNRSGFLNFIEEKCDFYISPNYLVPFKIEEVTCYETEIKNKIVPFESVESEITSAVYKDALKQVPSVDCVSNVSYSIVKEGKYTRVDCFIETIIDLI